MAGPLVVYGAYGYTGERIARRAVERGLSPVLAGRDSEPLARLARELGCAWRAFPLSDPEALRRGISGASAVIHCAGPFVSTARPMAEACLEERVHYLDITGEVAVFQELHAMGPGAQPSWKKKRKIMRRANQKSGNAPASIPYAKTARSAIPVLRTAVHTPSGMPTRTESTIAARINSIVAGSRCPMSWSTDWEVIQEVPNSPRTTLRR